VETQWVIDKKTIADETSNLQLSAYLLVKGFVLGGLATVDLRPVRTLIDCLDN
jgi:hypothetical protein